jgi:amino acid transporter
MLQCPKLSGMLVGIGLAILWRLELFVLCLQGIFRNIFDNSENQTIYLLNKSLLGAMFPLPRVLYAIASDGLIFRFLSKIDSKFRTPLIATIISGLFAGKFAHIYVIIASYLIKKKS